MSEHMEQDEVLSNSEPASAPIIQFPQAPPTDPGSIVCTDARCLELELQWLAQVLDTRLRLHFGGETEVADIREIPVPLLPTKAVYAQLVREQGFNTDERLVLALAMAPHLRPQLLDGLLIINDTLDRGFCEFGGWQGKHHGGFLPTCETAIFLLTGTSLDRRLELQHLFAPDHPFTQLDLIRFSPPDPTEPILASLLSMPVSTLRRLTTDNRAQLDFAQQFPAQRITSKLTWRELVLPPETKAEIDKVHSWMKFQKTIMEDWGLDKILQPGYRTLFYGPPGTGKTLAASLLGQRIGADVYRIDLSAVVSKYIGETEKNLALLFDQAANKNWILFFDEADTLFGKRTKDTTVNDRHANQETAFLLQRIENHPGIVILATNLKDNIDPAFFRRFQSVIAFPMPNSQQRLALWQQGLLQTKAPTERLDLSRIATDFELSGGSITNVIRQAALLTLEQGRSAISQDYLITAIERVQGKGKMNNPQKRPAVMIRGALPNQKAQRRNP